VTAPRKRAIGRVVRIVVTAAIVVLLVIFARTVDWAKTWSALRDASRSLLLLAIVVNLSSLIFRGIRWWILLREVGAPSLWLAMRATFAGAGLNNVLVANGGEAARVVFVTRSSAVPSSRVLATVALDRLFDPLGFVALLAIGAATLQLPPSMARLRWWAAGAVVVVAILLVWLVLGSRTAPGHVPERRVRPRGWRDRSRAWLVEFGRSVRTLASGPRVISIVLLTLLAWVAQLATFALAAAAAHVRLPLAGSLAALLAVNVALIVRATPGNVGFFQFAYALSVAPFGVPDARAVAASVLIQALQIIPVTLLGVALAPEFILRRRKRSLEARDEHAQHAHRESESESESESATPSGPDARRGSTGSPDTPSS